MFNEKYSHGKKFDFDSSKNEFINLKDYAASHGMRFVVKGMFTYEGKKGTRAALVTDGFNVNIPEHLNKDVESIMNTPEEVEAVNAGKCAFLITTYNDEKYGNGTCYSGQFVDN